MILQKQNAQNINTFHPFLKKINLAYLFEQLKNRDGYNRFEHSLTMWDQGICKPKCRIKSE